MKRWLAATKHKWLLIIDNADDPDTDYANYFPSGNRGCILLTTRIPECRKHGSIGCHTLRNLERDEAIQLLLEAAHVNQEMWETSKAAAEKVVNVLGSHVLAIVQAGAYIESRYCTMEDYPMHFKEQRQRILQFRPKQALSDYKDVYATFEVSAKRLEGSIEPSAKIALQLLRFLAFVHFADVPMSILERAWHYGKVVIARGSLEDNQALTDLPSWHALRLPPFMQEARVVNQKRGLRRLVLSALPSKLRSKRQKPLDLSNWSALVSEVNMKSLHEARAVLASFSIISIDPRSGNMTMHPLAHAWAKDRLEPSEMEDAAVSVGCVLALSIARGRDWNESFRQQILPHVESYWSTCCFEASVVPPQVLQFLYWIGALIPNVWYWSDQQRVHRFVSDCKSFELMTD